MKARNDFTQRRAEFRWWGCVLLAMFVVVQAAHGSVEPPKAAPSDSTRLLQTSAAFDPSKHRVTIHAAIPATTCGWAAQGGYAGDLRIQTP